MTDRLGFAKNGLTTTTGTQVQTHTQTRHRNRQLYGANLTQTQRQVTYQRNLTKVISNNMTKYTSKHITHVFLEL